MTRVLITRPQPDADRTAQAMREAGLAPLVHPLMRIEMRAGVLCDAGPADALAFTSANGVRAYAKLGGDALPVYAVGPASAREAERCGFAVAGVADGDVASLAALIGKNRPGRVRHPSGAAAAGDLAGSLATAGIAAERLVLYDAITESALPEAAAAILEAGFEGGVKAGECWVALYSPRSARLFERLVASANLTIAAALLRLAALSPAVADAARLPYAERRVAVQPTNSALVDIISARPT